MNRQEAKTIRRAAEELVAHHYSYGKVSQRIVSKDLDGWADRVMAAILKPTDIGGVYPRANNGCFGPKKNG